MCNIEAPALTVQWLLAGLIFQTELHNYGLE